MRSLYSYYYKNRKAIPADQRHDKLVNTGRMSVFMGYSSNTTKHFRVYSPEHGYTILRSIIRVNELVKGGTMDLRLHVKAGPQGTPNIVPNQKAKGRPRKDHLLERLTLKATPQVVIPFFKPPENIPTYTEKDIADRGNTELT
jgi:hypothetical protein